MSLKAKRFSRRTFLRGSGGVALALPFLDSMAMAQSAASPRRIVGIGTTLGWVPGEFFPAEAGANYTMPRVLEPLAHLRKDFTVFSGLDHGVNAQGGHLGCHAFFSGVLNTNAKNYPMANISVDQMAAEHVGAATRYPSLSLSPETNDAMKMSWNRAGISIMPVQSLKQTFDLLFRQDDTASISTARKRLQDAQSILDVVNEDAKKLSGEIGALDRERLDQYLTSVRDLEIRLTQSDKWLDVPKPTTSFEVPGDADQAPYKDRLRMWYDLMALALQTDSTRAITLELSGIREASSGFNVSRGYHALSHHGKIPELLKELHVIELFHMQEFARFLDTLKSVTEPDGSTLLDSTMALIGSGLGNASSHSNKELPLLLAGGGFKHGNHYVVPENKRGGDEALAANLYLSMLQRFGLEIDSYNGAKHNLTGLEFA